MTNDSKVQIVEVGPRDGLQNEFIDIGDTRHKITLAPEVIATYIKMLANAGLKKIEGGSFVRPDFVPQMKGTSIVSSLIKGYRDRGEIPSDVKFSFLVPNQKGLENAIEAGVDEIAVFVATTDEFTQKNLSLKEKEGAVEASFAMLEKWVPDYAKKTGNVPVRGYLSTVFGGAYKPPEEVSPEKVVKLARRLLDMGCYEVSLGDTTGIANPEKVEVVTKAFINADPPIELSKIAMHFHDTHGLAAENIKTAHDLGIRVFDSATGGVGGCPFAGDGAKGNVATDIAINALPADSLEHPVDLKLLKEAADYIQREIDLEKSRVRSEETEKTRQCGLAEKLCHPFRKLLGRG